MLAACGESRSQEDSTPPPTPVGVVTLKHQPVTLTRELPGRVRASLVAEVRPQVGGIIRRQLFVEGGYVKAGQALYELDDASYRADFESAQAGLRKAQATAHAAQLAARRARELAASKLLSAQDNDSAIAAEAQAAAEVGVARAAVDSARVNLDRARIVAPISGRIGKSSVTEGALVTANQDQALALIQQLDPMYVEVNQPSSNWLELKQAIEAGRVRTDAAGAAVTLVLENGTTYSREGKLQFTDVTVDQGTGNFLLRAVVPNPDSLLLPGMYVRAVVSEGVSPEAVLAPQRGITRDPRGNATALVVGKDGKAATRDVQVSRTIGDQWLVEAGLAAGDRVIVEGVQNVQPGAPVQATEQGAKPVAAAAGAAP
ncbi:efflux RND transporter periplasmic adaptor subunit [Lysobacter fragariae]